ncbi:MAG TPA: phosphoribosyltransferase [Kofleriaceae bacterium]|nr:phosphoribosyltransferase [Kofleriaceae bacterium]
MPQTRFQDRRSAGRLLGQALRGHAADAPLVLGLPRGGVPVAFEIASALGAPLDVWVVRKLGVPFQPELGMGALAEGPALYLDRELIAQLGLGDEQVLAVARREQMELERRVARFRRGAPPPDVRGRTVIVVDDGIATGGTTRAAIEGLRARGAGRVVLAVPVASPDVIDRFRSVADEVVCLAMPRHLMAIGAWYDDFRQVSDEQVLDLLEAARERREGAPPPP